VPLITGAGYLFTMRVLARRQPDPSNSFTRTAASAD
jgi:hypothetical protein